MSINVIPPVSLHEIRHNFAKSGEVSNTDRYVRDFNALQSGDVFNLLDYSGAAFGFQKEFMGRNPGEPKWQGHGSIYELPLDESDRRADGAVDLDGSDALPWTTNGGAEGIGMRMQSRYYHRTPGAVGVNGWFYASDVGSDKLYEADWVLETGSEFPDGAEMWGMLFGYRYGYLDGARIEYASQRVSNAKPNTKYEFNHTFSVDKNYRHCLMNFSIFMPGFGRDTTARAFIHSCTIKRKP